MEAIVPIKDKINFKTRNIAMEKGIFYNDKGVNSRTKNGYLKCVGTA